MESKNWREQKNLPEEETEPVTDSEYRIILDCTNCYGLNAIAIKKGVSIEEVSTEMVCRKCGLRGTLIIKPI